MLVFALVWWAAGSAIIADELRRDGEQFGRADYWFIAICGSFGPFALLFGLRRQREARRKKRERTARVAAFHQMKIRYRPGMR